VDSVRDGILPFSYRQPVTVNVLTLALP